MKIAFFHELTPLSGARKVVEEYGKILRKDHSIDLFYVDDIEDKKVKKIFNKVYYFKFKFKKYEGNNWKTRLYKDSIELLKLYFLHKKISNIIKGNKYDFIFINPSKFTQAPFLLRFIEKSVYFCEEPLRIVYDNLFEFSKDINSIKKIYEKLNRKVRKFIDKDNIKKANIVLANSQFTKDNINKAYGIKACLCYLGVAPKKFLPLTIKKEYDLLFIGEKNNIEGYDLLEDVIKLYKQAPKVMIVVRDIDGNGISEENLIKEYNKSKIVLTLSKNEPFGLSIIEAMACGVPVIALNEGGFKESVVDNKTGFLIKRNPYDLKAKIDLLLEDDNLRDRLGKAGRNRVLTNFTWKISVSNFLKFIRNL